MFDHINLPYPEMAEYLEHSVENSRNARATLENKIRIFRGFSDFTCGIHKCIKVQDITADHFQKWMQSLVEANWARETIKVHVSVVFTFWRWMVAKGYQDPIESPLLRMSTYKFDGKPPKCKAVLLPESIFQCRTSGYGTLAQACIFEVGICTGMRVGEIYQLRACDISWGKIPTDKELQCPSPYVCASIFIEPTRHVIKNRRRKRMFISKIAGKLLRLWMQERRIPEGSNLPLFPFAKNCATNMMKRFSRRTKLKVTNIETHLLADEAYDVDQYAAMEDVDLNTVEDDLMVMMIRRHQRQEYEKRRLLGIGPVGRAKKEAERSPRSHLLNPHLMRYTNISLMFYRTFTGERMNELAIKMTSGHSLTKQLRNYLVDNDIVKNDIIWKTLWLGKADHWNNLLGMKSNSSELYNGMLHQQGYNKQWGKAE